MSIKIDHDAVQKALREKRERECFGCTVESLREGCFLTNWEDPESLIMLSMSIQSDLQEMLNFSDYSAEEFRQYLNRSKYALGEASRLIRKNMVSRLPGEWGVK
jgi:hypothetical protein